VFRRRDRTADPGEPVGAPAPQPRPVTRRGGVAVLPTQPMLRQLLEEYALSPSIDDDGDLVVRGDRGSVFLFQYGEHGEVLQARLYLSRRFEVEKRTGLISLLDDWNRTRLVPKAYTVLPDDGLVGICAEHCFDFDGGVTRAALKYTVGWWISTLRQFAEWVDEQV
jgi:hypothetical protein